MEAALPGEETAAASALVSMNTSPAAAPRPAAPALEAEISVLAKVPVSCKQAACVTLAMCLLLNSSVWSQRCIAMLEMQAAVWPVCKSFLAYAVIPESHCMC